jgi:hypothetical protein
MADGRAQSLGAACLLWMALLNVYLFSSMVNTFFGQQAGCFRLSKYQGNALLIN